MRPIFSSATLRTSLPSTVSTVDASRTSAEAGVDVPGGWSSWGASDVGMVVDSVGPSAPDGEPDNASSRAAITAINIETTAIPMSKLCNAGRRQMVRPALSAAIAMRSQIRSQLPNYRSAAGAWLHDLQALGQAWLPSDQPQLSDSGVPKLRLKPLNFMSGAEHCCTILLCIAAWTRVKFCKEIVHRSPHSLMRPEEISFPI